MFGLRPSGQGMMKIILVCVFEQAQQCADPGHLFSPQLIHPMNTALV